VVWKPSSFLAPWVAAGAGFAFGGAVAGAAAAALTANTSAAASNNRGKLLIIAPMVIDEDCNRPSATQRPAPRRPALQ
jgi:hypothetical protein